MKKSKILLSLVMMLCLSVPVFAVQPKEEGPDCVIPPQPPQCQQEKDFNDEFMPFWNTDMCQKDCRPFDSDMDPHKKFFEGKGKFFNKKFKDLNFTDKQKEDLKNLRKTCMDYSKETISKFKEKAKALNNELLKEKYSAKEIKKLTKDLKVISAKMIDNKVSKKEGMRKILTFEQYNKLFKVKTHYDIMAERLGLSAEQKEKFIKILENKRDKENTLRQQMREKDILLKKEFEKENLDKKAISKLSEDISNISKELFKTDIDAKIELKSILTTEQYNKFINPRPNPIKPIIYEPTVNDKNIDKK